MRNYLLSLMLFLALLAGCSQGSSGGSGTTTQNIGPVTVTLDQSQYYFADDQTEEFPVLRFNMSGTQAADNVQEVVVRIYSPTNTNPGTIQLFNDTFVYNEKLTTPVSGVQTSTGVFEYKLINDVSPFVPFLTNFGAITNTNARLMVKLENQTGNFGIEIVSYKSNNVEYFVGLMRTIFLENAPKLTFTNVSANQSMPNLGQAQVVQVSAITNQGDSPVQIDGMYVRTTGVPLSVNPNQAASLWLEISAITNQGVITNYFAGQPLGQGERIWGFFGLNLFMGLQNSSNSTPPHTVTMRFFANTDTNNIPLFDAINNGVARTQLRVEINQLSALNVNSNYYKTIEPKDKSGSQPVPLATTTVYSNASLPRLTPIFGNAQFNLNSDEDTTTTLLLNNFSNEDIVVSGITAQIDTDDLQPDTISLDVEGLQQANRTYTGIPVNLAFGTPETITAGDQRICQLHVDGITSHAFNPSTYEEMVVVVTSIDERASNGSTCINYYPIDQFGQDLLLRIIRR